MDATKIRQNRARRNLGAQSEALYNVRAEVKKRAINYGDALRILGLLRDLSMAYGTEGIWGLSYERAFFGRPGVDPEPSDEDLFGPDMARAIATGEQLVREPGNTIRALLIGVERAAHEARGASRG